MSGVNIRNLEKILDKWLLFQRFVTSIVGLKTGVKNVITHTKNSQKYPPPPPPLRCRSHFHELDIAAGSYCGVNEGSPSALNLCNSGYPANEFYEKNSDFLIAWDQVLGSRSDWALQEQNLTYFGDWTLDSI